MTETHGVTLQGGQPRALELSDGTVLMLESERSDRVAWRLERESGDDKPVSLPEAMRLAGEPFAGYVRVRTRVEAEWMRAVADWYRHEADILEQDLKRAGAG